MSIWLYVREVGARSVVRFLLGEGVGCVSTTVIGPDVYGGCCAIGATGRLGYSEMLEKDYWWQQTTYSQTPD